MQGVNTIALRIYLYFPFFKKHCIIRGPSDKDETIRLATIILY